MRHRHRRPHPLLRLFLLWLLLPTFIVLATRIIWGYHAAHRLTALRQQLHNQGLKVYSADFPDPKTVPPTDNAAVAVADALRQFSALHIATSSENYPYPRRDNNKRLDLQRTAQESADLRSANTRARPSLELLDQAAQRTSNIWPQPRDRRSLVSRSDVRAMGSFLFDMALVAHADHDDAQAILHLRRIFVLAIVSAEFSDLYAISAYQEQTINGSDALIALLPLLDLHSPTALGETRTLLRSLQKEPSPEVLTNYYQASLTRNFDYPPSDYDFKDFWLLGPLTRDNNARLSQTIASDIIPTLSTNFQRTIVRRARSPVHSTHLDIMFRQGASISPKTWLQYYRAIAACRSAALLVAARLYALDHDSPPADPAVLVPGLLPALPLDPFADPDRPLHYHLAFPDLKVWSIGDNGIDDSSKPPGWPNDDQVFTLTFPSPTP